MELERATTPLFYGPLEEFPRPWEPKFSDSIGQPSRTRHNRAAHGMEGLNEPISRLFDEEPTPLRQPSDAADNANGRNFERTPEFLPAREPE